MSCPGSQRPPTRELSSAQDRSRLDTGVSVPRYSTTRGGLDRRRGSIRGATCGRRRGGLGDRATGGGLGLLEHSPWLPLCTFLAGAARGQCLLTGSAAVVRLCGKESRHWGRRTVEGRHRHMSALSPMSSLTRRVWNDCFDEWERSPRKYMQDMEAPVEAISVALLSQSLSAYYAGREPSSSVVDEDRNQGARVWFVAPTTAISQSR